MASTISGSAAPSPSHRSADQLRAVLRRRSALRDWLAICALIAVPLATAGAIWALAR